MYVLVVVHYLYFASTVEGNRSSHIHRKVIDINSSSAWNHRQAGLAHLVCRTRVTVDLSVGGSSRVVLISPGKVLQGGVVHPARVEGSHLRP